MSTQARKHAKHVTTQARKHIKHASTQARKHAKHVSTQARQARYLADSKNFIFNTNYTSMKFLFFDGSF